MGKKKKKKKKKNEKVSLLYSLVDFTEEYRRYTTVRSWLTRAYTLKAMKEPPKEGRRETCKSCLNEGENKKSNNILAISM